MSAPIHETPPGLCSAEVRSSLTEDMQDPVEVLWDPPELLRYIYIII